ncbi:hypothetical protein [Streptomyces auratus]|uniref:Regulatory protein n=1 Tax=Streptomyces auratus AGR0001 TaxID=1160718 RepID=J1ZQA1_9ACTN|nr:hypothetical protein [Streptomyces auratus]QTZ90175.1 hypothetical protein SU9_000850 [Streptomyces auratus AGR0001]
MSDSEFAAQVAAKLERITLEIDELQKLKSKLEDIQLHLGTQASEEPVAPQPAEADAEVAPPVTVPAARRSDATAPKAKPAKKSAKKAPAKAARSAKKPPAKVAGGTKKTRKATTARVKARQKNSTRADRVLALLDEQPRTVAEMTKLLTQEHPDHSAPETAVRNTLETSLVAKGLAHRSKQGRSVFYSRPAPAAQAGTGTKAKDAVEATEEAAPASV